MTRGIASGLVVAFACGCGDVVPKQPDGGGNDDGGMTSVGIAGRLLAPLSTTFVTSRRPTVRWELSAGSTDPVVEFCADRACADVLTTGIVSGSTAIPMENLPPGNVYWRVRATGPASEPTRETIVWSFRVGASRTIDTSWGSVYDANGDGIVDLAVGAPCAPSPAAGMCGPGRVLVYLGTAAPSIPDPIELSTNDADGARVGDRLAGAGDLNGDGYAELLVTAKDASPPGKPDGGRVHVFAGGPDGPATTPYATIDGGDGANVDFGHTLVALGDVDADGYGDFAVGVPGKNLVRVFRGGASGVTELAMLTTAGLIADARLGAALAACDLDGDTRPDLVVGAPRGKKVANQEEHGAIYVFRGDGTTLVELTTAMRNGSDPYALGASVVCDDFSSDGYPDVVAGRPGGYRNPPSTGYEDGNVYVYSNMTGTLETSRSSVVGQHPVQSYAYSGTSLSAVGDVNNDGYVDLAIGSQYDLRVVYGSMSGLGRGPMEEPLSERTPHHAGGDLNGDGFADLVVANQQGSVGAIRLYFGGSTGIGLSIDEEGAENDEFGYTVSTGSTSGQPYY